MTLMESVERWFMGPLKPHPAIDTAASLAKQVADLKAQVTTLTLERDNARRERDAEKERADEATKTIEEAISVLTGEEPIHVPQGGRSYFLEAELVGARRVPRRPPSGTDAGLHGPVDPTWGDR